MHSKGVNLVITDAHSPSLEVGEGSGMARNNIFTAGMLCSPVFWLLPLSAKMHQKMIWTARSVQNKARLSTGGRTDTEQVYPWHVQGIVGSTMPQTCGKTMVTFAVATWREDLKYPDWCIFPLPWCMHSALAFLTLSHYFSQSSLRVSPYRPSLFSQNPLCTKRC